MEKKDFYTHEEMLDEFIGKIGTPERDAFEAKLQEEVSGYYIGEAIKAERKRQGLTQEQLGERMGVQKSQISRLERGKSIALPSVSRVFKALGVTTGILDLGAYGRVALW